MKLTFGKEERLKSRRQIEELMVGGTALHAGPLKLVWMEKRGRGSLTQASVAVSKRNFKKAVDRNILKRRMREAYRKAKPVLFEHLEQKNKYLDLLFFHVSKKLSDYALIESGMNNIIKKLAQCI